ncbi:MAG: Cupin domain protein [Frankiales bacterium]|nr:Cupin domain protein [Frankiales bacterium]
MGATVTAGAVAGLTDGDVLALMAAGGLDASFWTGAPGQEFGRHSHEAAKVLYVVAGALTFTLGDGSTYAMVAGDRIDLAAGTDHSASVGPVGVRCIEAFAGQ